MLFRHLPLVLLSFLAIGCGAANELPLPPNPEEKKVIEQVERIFESDRCDPEHEGECRYTDVKFKPASPSNDGETILLFDVQLRTPTLGLHSDRVVAHFRATSAPDYFVPYAPTVKMPEAMDRILHQVFRGKTAMASSKALLPLGEKFSRKYVKLVEGAAEMGHGSTSFNVLSELNPQAKFVIVHADETFHRPPICELAEEEGETKLEDYWKERGTALAKIAKTFHVGWVNYSMGYDLKEANDLWRSSHCKGERPSIEKMRAFIQSSNELPKALTKVPGLLFVQAAAYPDRFLDEETQKDFCADCEVVPGRLRVGYLNLESNALALWQTRNLGLLSDTMKNVAPCADLFVRDGLQDFLSPTKTPIYYSAVGFGHGTMNIPGTSFIAPVGLAHAAYLMKTKALTAETVVPYLRGDRDEPLLVTPFEKREFLNQDPRYLNWH